MSEMAGYGAPEQEAPEQETTCVCPNCGATLKIEVEQPEAEAPEGGPSIRDALQGAMGGQ